MLASPCELDIILQGDVEALHTAKTHILDNTLLPTFAPTQASDTENSWGCEGNFDLEYSTGADMARDTLSFGSATPFSPPIKGLAKVAQALGVSIYIRYINYDSMVCGYANISKTGVISDHKFTLSDFNGCENTLRAFLEANPSLENAFEYETLCFLVGVEL